MAPPPEAGESGFSVFVSSHRAQLEHSRVPESLWESVYEQICGSGSREKLECERDPLKVEGGAATSWSLTAAEDLDVDDVFVFGHALTCDAADQTRQALQNNPDMLDAVWQWFDGDLNIPEPLAGSHQAALQIEDVKSMVDCDYPLALAALVASDWETINAVLLIEEGVNVLAGSPIGSELDVRCADNYSWTQEADGTIIVLLPVGSGTSTADVDWQLTSSHLQIAVKGESLIKGTLPAPIDPEASTWFFPDPNTIEIVLSPREGPSRWTELIQGDAFELRSSRYALLSVAQKAQIAMKLMTSYFAQSYAVARLDAAGNLHQPLTWYILEPLGLALEFMEHEEEVNCANIVLIYLPTGAAYSIVFPTTPIESGEPLRCHRTSKTRDQLN